MDLTQLEMFNAVALTGSITRAAQKVHRVPSNPHPASDSWEADLGVGAVYRENPAPAAFPAGTIFALQQTDPGAGRRSANGRRRG